MILVLLEHELITISGGTEESKNRKYFSDLGFKVFFTTVAAGVFLILHIFTIILQQKSLDLEILQKEEMVITECRFSKEAILGFLKAN